MYIYIFGIIYIYTYYMLTIKWEKHIIIIIIIAIINALTLLRWAIKAVLLEYFQHVVVTKHCCSFNMNNIY